MTNHPNRARTSPFRQARATLDAIGISLSHSADEDEYRVNLKGASERTAYYTYDLDDALDTGRAMADEWRASRIKGESP